MSTDPDQPRALLISPEAPYPLDGGGPLRTASLMQYLGERYALDMVIFRHPEQDVTSYLPSGLIREVNTITLRSHRTNVAARLTRNGERLLRHTPPLVDRFSGYESEVLQVLQGRRYDVSVVEHFWAASYLPIVRKFSKLTILDLHNIESIWHEGCARIARFPRSWAHRRFARAAKRLERSWLANCDLLLTPSAADLQRVRVRGIRVPVKIFPNSIPFRPIPYKPPDYSVAFAGNLEYEPNQVGVKFFLDSVWPLLAARFPTLKFRIVGKNAHAIAAFTQGKPRVEVTGPVEDAFGCLAASEVCVAPLLSGSGTRLKIIEYWAARKPVVSTRIGAEGLNARDGDDVLLADNPAAFAAAVERILTDEHLRWRLSEFGRARYERDFTWKAAWLTISDNF